VNNRTDHGFLILADVSGFTRFVTTTELEHGSDIIAALLDEVVGHLSPPLEIQEIEGDAVFALGGQGSPLPKARLLDILEDAFAAFKTRQRAMQEVETCPCGACRQSGSLDLKMVVHHGPFLRHMVGGRNRVTGTAVILVHRLLKNGLDRKGGYALLTEPVLRSLGLDAAKAGLAAHTEHYEHLGDVRCFVRDLTPPSTLSPLGRGQGEGAGADEELHPQAIA
jgi:class 3 adenylate cyclase